MTAALFADVGRADSNKSPATREIDRERNIAYRTDKDADPIRHKLDVYFPKGGKDCPVLFFVHGGAWRSGNKNIYTKLGETLAANGIVTVVTNYRLSPNVAHPAHIQDITQAFAWTCRNVEKYGGCRENVFACGHSAGGHLVALMATDERYLKAEKLSLSQVRGVIPMSGVYNIEQIGPLFRNVFGEKPSQHKDAAPLSYVRSNLPPFLVVYADKELPSLDKMAEEFTDALKKCECDVCCKKIDNRTHISIIIMAMETEDPATQAIVEFVRKNSVGNGKDKAKP
jgi:acetyl esterase/lipase